MILGSALATPNSIRPDDQKFFFQKALVIADAGRLLRIYLRKSIPIVKTATITYTPIIPQIIDSANNDDVDNLVLN
jgi:hypothetical protein